MLARARKSPTPSVREETDLAIEALLAMAKTCEALEAELLFVCMPMRPQTESAPYPVVRGTAGRVGSPHA